MTARRRFKQLVRARAAKTGESYTAALRQVRRASAAAADLDRQDAVDQPDRPRLRVAVAQTDQREDPRDTGLLRAAGAEIRALIDQAAGCDARLLHLPEGALCFPHKRVMSSLPDRVGPADWSRVAWEVYAEELAGVAEAAARRGIWVALPAAHRLADGHRPHNSLYVIDDHGRVHTRYDERYGSDTKINYLYTPGTEPIIFEIDGVRIGCTLGIEAVHPQSFIDYERLGVDLVIFSTTGRENPTPHPTPFWRNLAVYAGVNGYPISIASTLPGNSGILPPDDQDPIRITEQPRPALVTGEITARVGATPWLERLRSGVYDQSVISDDARSLQRTTF